MVQSLSYLRETPSQTAGPYVHIGLTPNRLGIPGIYPVDLGLSPIAEGAKGERITLTGRVIDGQGMILRDAVIETWQADAAGIYPNNDPRGAADPAVIGWARIAADFDSGIWRLDTIKPGRVNVWGTIVGVMILAVGISGIQQFGGSFWVEPLFNGTTLLIAIGIAGYAQRKKGAKSK